MKLIPLDGIEPKCYPKPTHRAVTLQLGALRFELSAAEALKLADHLVDVTEKLHANTNGKAHRR